MLFRSSTHLSITRCFCCVLIRGHRSQSCSFDCGLLDPTARARFSFAASTLVRVSAADAMLHLAPPPALETAEGIRLLSTPAINQHNEASGLLRALCEVAEAMPDCPAAATSVRSDCSPVLAELRRRIESQQSASFAFSEQARNGTQALAAAVFSLIEHTKQPSQSPQLHDWFLKLQQRLYLVLGLAGLMHLDHFRALQPANP